MSKWIVIARHKIAGKTVSEWWNPDMCSISRFTYKKQIIFEGKYYSVLFDELAKKLA